MKPFQRVKLIGGAEYVYEITPYYDPETKNTRQKSKYLGKLVDGKPERVRSNLPRNAFDYGEISLCNRLIADLRLDKLLERCLSRNDANRIFTLAINRIVAPVSMANIETWFERTSLIREMGELSLSSQCISDFLDRIGNSSIHEMFTKELMESIGPIDTLYYDITSLSSNSKLIELLEWGHNRDGEKLPQINLSIIAHKQLGIPLDFNIYPGSIPDCVTLKNSIEKLNAFGLEKPTMIMDRAFFNDTNLSDLVEAGFDFMMPASETLKVVKSLISTSNRDLENPKFLHRFEGGPLFVKPVTFDFKAHKLKGYLYYDIKREKDERLSLYNRLLSIKEQLEERTVWNNQQAVKVFADLSGNMASCLSWTVEDHHFKITIKPKAVAQRTNREGKTIIVYSGEHDWEDVLSWYREKDAIEKIFCGMKNDLEGLPLRAHKSSVIEGMIFVTFIALILRARLLTILKETKLNKDYSIPALVLELSKIKNVELENGTYIHSEITKKQRNIIETLKMENYFPRMCLKTGK